MFRRYPLPVEIFEMTQSGIDALREELERRKVKDRTEIGERIREALSFGDLSENSEYDDAKQAQSENEQRIHEIEHILKNARVIEQSDISRNKVTLGAKVKLEDLEKGKVEDYTVVNAKEEDIFRRHISQDSPVGQAILGRRKGEIIQVTTPRGMKKFKILEIGLPS